MRQVNLEYKTERLYIKGVENFYLSSDGKYLRVDTPKEIHYFTTENLDHFFCVDDEASPTTVPYSEVKEELLKDPETKDAYEKKPTIIIMPDEDEYHAFSPTFKNIHVWGSTYYNAFENILDAVGSIFDKRGETL